MGEVFWTTMIVIFVFCIIAELMTKDCVNKLKKNILNYFTNIRYRFYFILKKTASKQILFGI